MEQFRKIVTLLHARCTKYFLFAALAVVWLGWDINQANRASTAKFISFFTNEKPTEVKDVQAKVAIVRSDDSALANPTSLDDANITEATIEQMVRKAIDLTGGINKIVKSGNTVLIKPNIVSQAASGSGEVTDVRVIKALVKVIDEVDHGKIKILCGDGSPRPFTTFEKATGTSQKAWTALYDVPGYPAMTQQIVAAGIDFKITNLNGNSDTDPWPELKLVDVPGGGTAQPQGGKYYIHQDIVNADVYITVPVMKIHDPGITVALKNQIGIAASTKYGFNKQAGVKQDSYQHKLQHLAQAPYNWTDKEIVDLSAIAKIKYVLVDAIQCLETQKTANGSNAVRMNTIIAGADPVAVDHICARIMGLNPDDIEHITLAERMGLGTNNDEKITVVGRSVAQTQKRFKKALSASGTFGQSNRDWILNGPFPVGTITDPINYEFIANEATLAPKPGINSWSQSTYFINDRINLKDYYNLTTTDKVVSYAFTWFNAPRDQQAELWVGSDEALKIYINGAVAYNFNSTRAIANSAYYSEIVTVNIKKGWNTLLVKSLQKSGTYDFSLNICDVESDVNFRGNRVWGLKFKPDTTSTVTGIVSNTGKTPASFQLMNNYPNPFNPSTVISYLLPADNSVSLKVYDLAGSEVATLVNEHQTAGTHKVTFNAVGLTSGVYFYKLRVGKTEAVKKFVLIK